MKCAGGKLLGWSVRKFHRPARKAFNSAIKTAEDATFDFFLVHGEQRTSQNIADGAAFDEDFSDKFIPDGLRPSGGLIFVGTGCASVDLQPEDFDGMCFFGNIDARFVFGTTATAMLLGLNAVHRSRLERLLLEIAPPRHRCGGQCT